MVKKGVIKTWAKKNSKAVLTYTGGSKMGSTWVDKPYTLTYSVNIGYGSGSGSWVKSGEMGYQTQKEAKDRAKRDGFVSTTPKTTRIKKFPGFTWKS